MKKMKKLLVVTLGALLICVGINIMDAQGPDDDPRPQGSIQNIYLG